MDQKTFNQIIERYLYGNASEEEKKLVEKWYLSIEDSKPSMDPFNKFRIKQRIRRRLDAHLSEDYLVDHSLNPSHVRFSVPFSWKLSIAVAFCGALIAGWYVFLYNPRVGEADKLVAREMHEQLITSQLITNEESSVKTVTLDDGSLVSLSPGSIVQVSDSFNMINRKVVLRSGKGFFQVKSDKSKPFFVYTEKIVTRVLGTSFTVDVSEPDIVVAVRSGRVSVFSKSSADPNQAEEYPELILTPNQKAMYDSNEGRMLRSLVEEPLVVVSPEVLKDMKFESAKVPVILEAVSKAYGVTIEYESEVLSSCVLTTFLIENEDLYKRLGIICEAINASYQVDGINIRITSAGCNPNNSGK